MDTSDINNKGNQEKYSFGFALLLCLIVIKFINIPRVGGMPVAPINFFIMISMLFILLNLKELFYINIKIYSFFLLLIIYLFIKLFIELAFQDFTGNLMGNLGIPLRTIIIMITWILVCNTTDKAILFVKIFLIMAAVSTVFGVLVYFYGEPFTSLRLFLNKTHASAGEIVISKGSNLAGFRGLPHIWGYMLAGVPIITAALYFYEKKLRWLLMLFVFIIGLFLNAERSALLMNMIVFLWWFVLDKQRVILKIFIFAIFISGLLAVPSLLKITGLSDTGIDSTGSIQQGTLNDRMSGTTIQHAIDRILWQYYGIKSVLQHPLVGPTHEEYLRNVHSLSQTIKFLTRYSGTPYPHNHYINIGMKIGITAWIIIVLIFIILRKIDVEIMKDWRNDQKMTSLYTGIKLAIVAVLGNALLHNAGLLSFEFATCSIITMLFSLRKVHSGDSE